MIRIGIDTGGTYTDAVIVDLEGARPKVLAKAKALTTKEDLSLGIRAAIDGLPPDQLARVDQAAISTTLATNACVEGKGGRAKLIIVGTNDGVLHRMKAQETFGIPYSDVLTLPFEGSYDGSDVKIPDWEALYQSNPTFFEEADSFGVASLYALNNGAVVEHSAAQFLREKFGKIVIESVTVAAEPNVIGRGATALLNARLVPVISNFLDAICASFAEKGLNVPILIVRSDGTLMSEELARTRPVETILSGPAASVTGSQVLAGEQECLIADIGGTTSDISIVHGGKPNRTDGILIGGWKTQVAGVSIDTIALGGDTAVRFTKSGRLELGKRKVTPLCIAAARWPRIKHDLKTYYAFPYTDFGARYEFVYLVVEPGDISRFNEPERRLIEELRKGPISLVDARITDIFGLKLERLEEEGIVMRCGMTPTDAMHIKGDFGEFDVEASRLGAQCLLKSYKGAQTAGTEEGIQGLADEIYDLAELRLYTQVVSAFVRDTFLPDATGELGGQVKEMIRATWAKRHDKEEPPFGLRFGGAATLVGVGAPTHVFIGEVGKALGMSSVIPEHAGVANAIGAAASRVSVERRVVISPLRGAFGVVQGYQVRDIEFACEYENPNDALEAARKIAREQAIAEARRRGATGELTCEITEGRNVYNAAGPSDVLREWAVTAFVS